MEFTALSINEIKSHALTLIERGEETPEFTKLLQHLYKRGTKYMHWHNNPGMGRHLHKMACDLKSKMADRESLAVKRPAEHEGDLPKQKYLRRYWPRVSHLQAQWPETESEPETEEEETSDEETEDEETSDYDSSQDFIDDEAEETSEEESSSDEETSDDEIQVTWASDWNMLLD